MQFCFVLFNVRVSSLFADFMTCLWDPKQTASPGAVGVECLECVGPYLEQVLLSICVVQCSRDLPNEFQNFQPGQVKVVVMSGYITPVLDGLSQLLRVYITIYTLNCSLKYLPAFPCVLCSALGQTWQLASSGRL